VGHFERSGVVSGARRHDGTLPLEVDTPPILAP
jgi:hypothetical protein